MKKSRGADTRGMKAKQQKAASAREMEKKLKLQAEEQEAALWSIGSNTKKSQRDAKKAMKLTQLEAKKQAKKEAHEADEAMLSNLKSKGNKGSKKKVGKLTAFQRQILKQKREKEEAEAAKKAALTKGGAVRQDDMLLHTNKNKLRGDDVLLEASSLEGAISILDLVSGGSGGSSGGGDNSVDKHPEKRAKAAFIKFRKEQTPLMQQEYPQLKRSQINEKIWKLWQKSPDNPLLGK
jgi:hypothetical protein